MKFWESINKTLRCCNGCTNYAWKKLLITWILRNTWEMLQYKFTQEQCITSCARKIICNYCDCNYVSVDILYDGGNVYQQEDFGSSSSFFKKSLSLDVT